MLTEYQLPEETVVLDRTGEVELARLGDSKRDIDEFDEIPPIMLDATTAIEDKTFWENAGFDPVAIITAGSTSCAATAAAHRRSPSSWSVHACSKSTCQGHRLDSRAQAQGDHPVDPGDAVLQQAMRRASRNHHRLPQPELLRQPELRREGGGALLLRASTLADITPAQAASSPRSRSRPRTTTSCATPPKCTEPGRGRGRLREEPLVVPEDTTILRAPQPDPRAHGRGRPNADVRWQYCDDELRRGQEPGRARHPVRHAGRRRTSCGPSATSSRRSCATRSGVTAMPSTRAAYVSSRPSTSTSRRSPRSGSRPRRCVPRPGTPRAARQGTSASKHESLDGEPRGQEHLRNGAVVASTTRPASWSPMSVAPTTTRRAARSSSPSTTSSGKGSASRVRRSSRSTTRSASMTDADRGGRC